jgi:hypothetical protein
MDVYPVFIVMLYVIFDQNITIFFPIMCLVIIFIVDALLLLLPPFNGV